MRLVLSQDCLLCNSLNSADLLCGSCLQALPHHDHPACPRCAAPAPEGRECGRCLARPPAFDAGVAVYDYRYPLAELLHAFKYGGRLALGAFFGEALFVRVRDERWPDLLIPMPLHRIRLRERGFNQAAEIARHVALRSNLPLSLSLLEKVRDTAPQAGLPWKDRQANVKGAFACAIDLAGRRIVLVDDVMTTGATLNEAAKVLKKRGAAAVGVWVVARTLSAGDR